MKRLNYKELAKPGYEEKLLEILIKRSNIPYFAFAEATDPQFIAGGIVANFMKIKILHNIIKFS